MTPKKPLRLRWWLVDCSFPGRSNVKYFFTESEARAYLEDLKKLVPGDLDRYPDETVERYFAFLDDKDYGIEIRQLTAKDAVNRYPTTVAHLICHSLGYCTPALAGWLVLAAARNECHWCEWIATCYQSDPWPAVLDAIKGRHSHHGYMADIEHAHGIVESVRRGGPDPLLASWF